MNDDDDLLREHLRSVGCSSDEIEQVLLKLEEYDQRKIRESVFDSIETGSFDLEALLKEIQDENP